MIVQLIYKPIPLHDASNVEIIVESVKFYDLKQDIFDLCRNSSIICCILNACFQVLSLLYHLQQKTLGARSLIKLKSIYVAHMSIYIVHLMGAVLITFH